jgi:hypothetical protein
MLFSPVSCHFVSLWSKYSPQHPINASHIPHIKYRYTSSTSESARYGRHNQGLMDTKFRVHTDIHYGDIKPRTAVGKIQYKWKTVGAWTQRMEKLRLARDCFSVRRPYRSI